MSCFAWPSGPIKILFTTDDTKKATNIHIYEDGSSEYLKNVHEYFKIP